MDNDVVYLKSVIYMMRNIGEILCRLREERGMSQKDMAESLKRYGVSVTNQAVSKWEKGTTLPNARQFIALCGVLDIDDVPGLFLGRKSSYLTAGLSREGVKKLREYSELLRLCGMYSEKQGEIVKLRKLPLYDIGVSAGTGQFLDSDSYELVEVGDDVPLTANFGVRIAGDSMEPLFYNGQTVWVMQEREVRNGEVGIFFYDGDVYCKRFRRNAGGAELISENPEYMPIEILPEREFRVFGRVVG